MCLLNNNIYRFILGISLPLFGTFFVEEAFAQRPNFLEKNSEKIVTVPVQGSVTMIATGGSNIAVMSGESGLIIVDSGNIEAAANVVNEIRRISPLAPRYLINTSALPSHLAGNEVISEMAEAESLIGLNQEVNIPIVGHANGLSLLVSEFVDDVPYEVWPNSTFFGKHKSLFLNGEPIELIHVPSAITESDILVHFRRSDVIVTGDIFDTTSYPRFYSEYGGSLQGIIDALNLLIEIAIPEFNQQGGTLIIPGHGRLSSESDVVEYRDMLTIIRDRVQVMIDRGFSFEQVLAAQPSLEYNGIYGYESGEWTTSMFLEAVYEDLR